MPDTTVSTFHEIPRDAPHSNPLLPEPAFPARQDENPPPPRNMPGTAKKFHFHKTATFGLQREHKNPLHVETICSYITG